MDVFDLFATLQLKSDNFYSELEKAGKAIFAFTKDAVETGAAFDQAMSKVEAIAGATSDEMDALREKALQSSGQTKFTAEETADALVYMGMAGWKAAEMLDGLDAVMQLAAAGGEDVGRTSDIITDALTAFRQPASEAQHLADVLAVAMANSNTNINMLGESFKYAAPLAGQLGYSFEDVALALGLMANSGVKSGRAGRAVNNFLTRLANPPKKAKEALDELGISLSDAEGNMYSFRDVMTDLRLAMGSIDGGLDTESVGDYLTDTYTGLAKTLGVYEDFNDLLSGIYKGDYDLSGTLDAMQELFGDSFSWEDTVQFLRQSGSFTVNQLEKILALTESLGGKQALPALLAIIGASEEDFNALAKALDNATWATEEMAETMLDNLSGDITILRSNLDLLKIALSDEITPTIRLFTKSATSSIQKITEEYKKNGITGALGVMYREAKSLAANLETVVIPKIQEIGSSLIFTFTTMAHDPKIRGAIDAGIKTVFGFVEQLLTDNLDVIVSFSTLTFKALVPVIKGIIKGLAPVIGETLPDLIDEVLTIVPDIVSALEASMPKIMAAVEKLMGVIQDVLYKWYNGSWLQETVKAIPIIGSGANDTILAALGRAQRTPEEIMQELFTSSYDQIAGGNATSENTMDAFTAMISAADTMYDAIENLKVTENAFGRQQEFKEAAKVLETELAAIGSTALGANPELAEMLETIQSLYTEDENGEITLNVSIADALDAIDTVAARLNALSGTVYVNANTGSGIKHARSMYGGSILRGSTMFGWDAQGRPQYGGGEGAEAVVGVNSLGQMIAASVRGAFSGVSIRDSQPVTIQLVLDSGEVVSMVETEIARNVQWKGGGRA